MVPSVECAVVARLPDQFCLLFVSWGGASVHFVAIFAIYCVQEQYYETPIAVYLFSLRYDMEAKQHTKFNMKSFQAYQKSLKNDVAFISYSYAVSQRVGCLAALPSTG